MKDITFKKVCKDFLSNETYGVLNKHQCIDNIQRLLDDHLLYLGDFVDLAYFFNNTTVTKIIKNKEEIVINDIKPNQMFMIDFRFKSIIDTEKKEDEYARRFNIDKTDIIKEAYAEDLDDFVILLYKENDDNEYEKIRKILYSHSN